MHGEEHIGRGVHLFNRLDIKMESFWCGQWMKRFLLVLFLIGISGIGLGWWWRSTPWNRLSTESNNATSPESLFEEIRSAIQVGNHAKVLGGLTIEARFDLLKTMLIDCKHYASRFENKIRMETLTDLGMQMASESSALLKRHRLPVNNTKDPCLIADPNGFVRDAFNASASESGNYWFDVNAQLGEVHVNGDFASAEIKTGIRRQGIRKYYIHFKKRDGHWYIDVSPFILPWGTNPKRRPDNKFGEYPPQDS